MVAPDVQLKTVDVGGLVIDVIASKGDGNWYLQRKTFEEKVSLLYEFVANEQYVNFIDIGANYGLVSMLARKAAPGLNILSVEADPRLTRLIEPNFRANGLEPSVVVNCVAGHLDNQHVGFSLNPTSTLDNRVRMSQWSQVRVPMMRVGTLLDSHRVTGKTFFKIDTQGFELHVLQGLDSWLPCRDDWLLKMEFAPQWLESQGTDPLELLNYLSARYEFAEFPERIPFGVPNTEALFAYPVRAEQMSRFLKYVISLNKNGQGWVDLIVRPHQPARNP
jgi:FkbM family methyltransferase